MGFTVFVDDNRHYMDEVERYTLGEFADCESAVAACRRIVDEFLANAGRDLSADALFAHYRNFGEDTWIGGTDGNCGFSAWTYAKERCAELARAQR